MSGDTLLMVGTRKGLWIGRSGGDRESWTLGDPHFLMSEVVSCAIDTRGTGTRLLAGTMSPHWGPQVYRSDDLGQTWEETPNGAIRFPEDTGATLERVWQLSLPPAEPDVVYAGTQPSALFRSTDRGESFTMVRALWDHPHRESWGAGFGGQAIHTIVPDPRDSSALTVAMSTGGVYQTTDGGDNWRPANVGVEAYFMPDPLPEYGQCVHKVASNPSHPERMYLQNHHGVYRTDDGAGHWESIADGLPSDFGFPIVVDPHDSDTVYVFPLVADRERIPPQAKPRVWRSRDAGSTWTQLSSGLPESGFFTTVLRDAMCADEGTPTGLYLGSRDGNVYTSNDAGDTWNQAACHLPDVLCVRAAQLS